MESWVDYGINSSPTVCWVSDNSILTKEIFISSLIHAEWVGMKLEIVKSWWLIIGKKYEGFLHFWREKILKIHLGFDPSDFSH